MESGKNTMLAARIHKPRDMRLEQVSFPPHPKRGEVLIKVVASGICGSDLHIFKYARIGDTVVESPLIIGHEFVGIVEDLGEEPFDGNHDLLKRGARVAVDPARPCGWCEMCQKGNPNLCLNLQFCGNYPCDGCFCEYMIVPSRCCFPVPPEITDEEAVLLEPLGVAIHAIDLANIKIGDSVAILGAGPIGLLILQIAKLSGADPIFISDKFNWRLSAAAEFGAVPINCDSEDVKKVIMRETKGVDVSIEAAWGEESTNQAVDVVCNGGQVVLVGIPDDDKLLMRHSTARRKGLTILMCRRMKHTYPRAINLTKKSLVNLKKLITHKLPLSKINEAFSLNLNYGDNVIKVIVQNQTENNKN